MKVYVLNIYVLNIYDADKETGEPKTYKDTQVYSDKLSALYAGEKIRGDTNGELTFEVLDFTV